MLRERAWKAALVEQIAPQAGERILDLGCGTGTLTVLIKKAAHSAEIVGLDPDPEVLKRARDKAESAGLAISWRQGFADDPGEESGYNKVVSSLMFHHLATDAASRAFTTAYVAGRLPEFMREAGFEVVCETRRWATALGSLSFYRARKPG